MISYKKYGSLQDISTHLSNDIGAPTQIFNIPVLKIIVHLSKGYKAAFIVAQSKELKELTMSRDTANAILPSEIAKSERTCTRR